MKEDTRNTAWRWAELLFGGGVILYAGGATVSGIWWASSVNERLLSIERKVEGLDNVSLGNRVTALEVARIADVEQRKRDQEQSNRMEKKIDTLLERPYNFRESPPSRVRE